MTPNTSAPRATATRRSTEPRVPGALGLFAGIPIDAYHAGEGLSRTQLLDFAKSPLHYFALHRDPRRPPAPGERDGQLEGQLAHCAILEPDEFEHRYAIGPDVRRNTTAWRAFVDNHPHRVCVQEDQVAVAEWQAVRVRELKDVGALLVTKSARAEVSAYWRDATTGLLCRCRPDLAAPVGAGDQVILADVKTTGDASPAEFAHQVQRKDYALQAAYYSDGYAAASGQAVIGFVFIAVETSWPFAACACMLDDASLEAGRRRYRELLDRFAVCQAQDKWPSYSDTIELITLPPWQLS